MPSGGLETPLPPSLFARLALAATPNETWEDA